MKKVIAVAFGACALALMAIGTPAPAQARDNFGVYVGPNGIALSVERRRHLCRDYWYRRHHAWCHRYYGYYPHYNYNYGYYRHRDRDWRYRHHYRDRDHDRRRRYDHDHRW
jgi:hypothetical protein